MNKQTIIESAREYVFDLVNATSENGFKATGEWRLSLVSHAERKALEKSHHPTISVGLLPEAVRAFMTEVKAAMTLADIAFIRLGNLDLKTSEMQFLIAYNSKRVKQ